MLYELTRLSASQPMHGFGLGLQATWARGRRGALTFQGRLPQDIKGDQVDLRLESGGVRLFAGQVLALSRAVALIGGAALGVDVDHLRSSSVAGDLVAAVPFWVIEPLLRPSLQLELRQGPLIMALTFAMDVALVDSRYVISRPAMTDAAWVPARWRALLGLSLAVPL